MDETEPKRSGREKGTRGYNPEQDVDENTNSDKLGVFDVPGKGYGLFVKEVADYYQLPLCMDGWDDTRKKCYNKRGYANDAINWDGTKGKWKAEFVIGDYDR